MRRLSPHLFTFCSAVSLLLCVAMCVLWERSYHLTDELEYRSPGGFRAIGSASGNMVMQLNPGEMNGSPANYGWQYLRMNVYSAPSFAVAYGHLDPVRTYGTWQCGGFGWYTVHDRNGMSTATAVAPFSFVVAATAMLPLGWTITRGRAGVRKRRRSRLGRCPTCGCDLRASPERCLECGTSAPAVS